MEMNQSLPNNGNKVYSLPSSGYLKYAVSLISQFLFLIILAAFGGWLWLYFQVEDLQFTISFFSVVGILTVILLPMLFYLIVKRQQKHWQGLKIEMSADHIAIRHKGALFATQIMPPTEIVLNREQIKSAQEEKFGLVISTSYASKALVV